MVESRESKASRSSAADLRTPLNTDPLGSQLAVIRPVHSTDLPEIAQIIEESIRHSVAQAEADVQFLLDDIGNDLREWAAEPSNKLHLKCSGDAQIEGSLLIKNWWNLCLLFVRPDCQQSGVGRSLVQVAVAECRMRSPKDALWVNSSSVGEGFYRRLGFETNGDPIDRPGGCIPLRLDFR